MALKAGASQDYARRGSVCQWMEHWDRNERCGDILEISGFSEDWRNFSSKTIETFQEVGGHRLDIVMLLQKGHVPKNLCQGNFNVIDLENFCGFASSS